MLNLLVLEINPTPQVAEHSDHCVQGVVEQIPSVFSNNSWESSSGDLKIKDILKSVELSYN